MLNKKLLPHQAALVQAPYCFPEVRFFFLLGGYASGKTSALVDCVIKMILYYSGKLDKEGRPPKIGVCGITLTFLKKTFVGALVASFRNTKSVYNYDKAHNVIYVAGVELHLTPIINEEDVFGFDWCIGQREPVATLRGDVPIKDIRVGDMVLTRKGYKKVLNVFYKGKKEVRRIFSASGNRLVLTEDHKVFSVQEGFIEAKHLTFASELVTLSQGEQIWQENHEEQYAVKQSISEGNGITDTLTRQSMEEGHTSTRRTTRHYTKQYGKQPTVLCRKGTTSTTKMGTILTTLLRTLCSLLNRSTSLFTTLCGRLSVERIKQLSCGKHRQSVLKCSEKESPKTRKESLLTPSLVCVQSVDRYTKQQESTLNTVRRSVEQSTAERQDRLPQLYISKLSERSSESWVEDVYDIEVEDVHEFFAGGILVHNCAAAIDELDELPTYVSTAVVKSINDRCRQSVIGTRPPFLVFATTSQGLKGTYQVVQSFKNKRVNHVIIRARTKDNIHLPAEYIKSQYEIYNEKERRCLLDAEFISIDSGLTYPDYDPMRNRVDYSVYDTIKPKDVIYIGQDFNVGFNRAVAVVVRNGIIFIVKEYNFPDIRRAPEVFRYDFPDNMINWIPDATYNHHLPEYKKELRQAKINVKYRAKNPLIKDRSFLINKLFYSERMCVPEDCKDLDNALSIRQNDPVTGMPSKGKGETAPDHITDCLEYVVSYCAAWLPDLKDLYKAVLGRRMENRRLAGLAEEQDENYSDLDKEAVLNQAR